MHFKTHHVAFTVNSLDESIKWYCDTLGFTLVNRFKRPVRDTALLRKDAVQIELFGINIGLKPLPNYRKNLLEDLQVVGTKHLCIEVDDLDKTVSMLKKKGVEFVIAIDQASFGGSYTFFKDCNGILIELYQA
ncbi:MAG TPA: VOC family protein [Methylomirabilota bacterium]|nr:VOC family protein [Methylomirabilota bacterium]